MIVSVTRLRLRSWRYLLPFARATIAAYREHAPGQRDRRVLADRRLTFWTATLWDTEAAMLAWVRAGSHGRVMPLLAIWCDQASVVRWPTDDPALPRWTTCHDHMITDGRPSFVHHPAPGPIPRPRTLISTPARTHVDFARRPRHTHRP